MSRGSALHRSAYEYEYDRDFTALDWSTRLGLELDYELTMCLQLVCLITGVSIESN